MYNLDDEPCARRRKALLAITLNRNVAYNLRRYFSRTC